MRPRTLDQWLAWQMALHDKAIDLGLERVAEVGRRLGLARIGGRVVTVAGTNGKGSSVAAYETWLHNAGYGVASYTSPHILRYNERLKRNLEPVADAELCAAFAAVEAARGDTALTYFEFGTLAALKLIGDWQPDFAILEVGLGGRLDAVNIVDPDLAHLTPIGLDHQAWLGDNRELIGFEKAGILRDAIPVIVNDAEPPRSVSAEIERRDCRELRLGRDYDFTLLDGNRIHWQGQGFEFDLAVQLAGRHQAHNLAGVVAGLSRLLPLGDYSPQRVDEFFAGTRIAGRFESVASPLPCPLFLDVGHNPDAARVLADCIAERRPAGGRVVVLLGMLEDKQADEFVRALAPEVDAWWLLSLDCPRGQSAARLRERIESQVAAERLFERPDEALRHALSSLSNRDIMLATGSFVTVELIQRAISAPGGQANRGSNH